MHACLECNLLRLCMSLLGRSFAAQALIALMQTRGNAWVAAACQAGFLILVQADLCMQFTGCAKLR